MVVLPTGKVSHATGPKSPHFYHWDPSPTGPINVHPHSIPRRRPVPPPLDPRKHPVLSPVQRTWNKLSRLGKISVIAAIMLAFLALVIALPLGLMNHRHMAHARPIPQAGASVTGDLTYYDPAMGACGISSSSDQPIVAISHILFDASMINANPNDNPLCGKKITATKDGKSVVVTVVDRCVGCALNDLDVSESAFSVLADPSVGRTSVNWSWT